MRGMDDAGPLTTLHERCLGSPVPRMGGRLAPSSACCKMQLIRCIWAFYWDFEKSLNFLVNISNSTPFSNGASCLNPPITLLSPNFGHLNGHGVNYVTGSESEKHSLCVEPHQTEVLSPTLPLCLWLVIFSHTSDRCHPLN